MFVESLPPYIKWMSITLYAINSNIEPPIESHHFTGCPAVSQTEMKVFLGTSKRLFSFAQSLDWAKETKHQYIKCCIITVVIRT